MKAQLERDLNTYRAALNDSATKSRELLLKVNNSEEQRKALEDKLLDIKNKAHELQKEDLNMTAVGENLENMEEDPRAAVAFKVRHFLF